jgi:hypothetical protein
MGHTKEPWAVHQDASGDLFISAVEDGKWVAEIGCPGEDGAEQDARRIVACVNACAGISTGNLEQNAPVIELANKYNQVIQQRDEHRDGRLAALEKLVVSEAQRDELLAALSEVVDDLELRASLELDDTVAIGDGAYQMAKAAIAKVKGGA